MEYADTSFTGRAAEPGMSDQDRRLAEAFETEARKLRNFIRRRVPDELDAEDIVQDVFFELTEAYRLMKPVAHTGAWLFQVARNKITDLFRARRPALVEDGERLLTADLLPSPEEGPDAVYARRVLLGEIEAALDELPASQREVFMAHEIEGLSFKEIAAQTGVGVSTLLSRKHYAVLFLRRRLQSIYEETGRKTK
jgi:RNA polymerase sigma factor (sigma-70 family)